MCFNLKAQSGGGGVHKRTLHSARQCEITFGHNMVIITKLVHAAAIRGSVSRTHTWGEEDKMTGRFSMSIIRSDYRMLYGVELD